MTVRLHLVDGTFELYRAHYSPRPDAPDKATKGLVASLRALLRDEDEAVTHLAVAFDNPIRSFRNDLYAGYKSDEGVPPELRAQFDAAEEAVRALGVVVWSMDRFEADDALGTAATRFAGAVTQVRILSPDKDFGQVLSGTRVVLVDRIRKLVVDEDAYRAKHGVGPKSVPDYLALVGDVADGIPGVPGIGEKTAAALLGRYEKLEAIPEDAGAWEPRIRGAERVANALREHRDEARLWRTLATLVTDVPLAESLDALAVRR
jgi:5'-3' exonuclease